MRATRVPAPDRLILLGLLLGFAVSRLLAVRAGIVLDATRVGSLWQVIDPELLRTDLWRSLYYLHGQPPAFNAYLGVGIRAFGAAAGGFFHAFQMLCGGAMLLALFQTLRLCGVAPGLSVAASLLLSLSPAAIVYESWLFYPIFEAALLTVGLGALCHYVDGGAARSGAVHFGAAAGLVLLRSYFHLAWLLILVALALWLRPDLRRRTLRCAAVPLLLATLWYAKNAVQYGTFSSSTWFGMSFSRITIQSISNRARKYFAEDGVVSPLARLDSFGPLSRYRDFVTPGPPTGIPLLDLERKRNGRPNLHHAAYVPLSRLFLADSLALVRARPRIYARGLRSAFRQYLYSVTDDRRLDALVACFPAYNRLFDRLVYGRVGDRCVGVAVALPALVAFGVVGAFRARARGNRVLLGALVYCAFNVSYVSVAANAVELGENNRFRFAIEPLLAALFALFLAELLRRRSSPRAGEG